MYGNMLNNAQITSLVQIEKKITIRGFDPSKLKLAHYPITAGGIIKVGKINEKGKRETDPMHEFEKKGEYIFQPNEYFIVEIMEYIELSDGIVGHFLPSSNLIEQGFSLTLGKIDPGYGNLNDKPQQIRFGIKNLINDQNIIYRKQKIGHLYFIDLRGLNNAKIKWSNPDLEMMAERSPQFARKHYVARGDGPDYGDGNS